MKFRAGIPLVLLTGLCWAGPAIAEESGVRQDARAIEVLKSMSAFNGSLDRFTINSVSMTDARLGAGLIVTNVAEVEMNIDRPGSAHIRVFDGVNAKELFFDDGTFTVYNSENSYYAQAEIPKDLDAAMKFTVEDLEVDAPLLDLMYRDAAEYLVTSQETILYLTDKARVGGVDCHHLAIRGPESDVQLWVQEGDKPMLRKIIITSKWEGGSPRFVANLSWDTNPEFGDRVFQFKAPEGATNIGFHHSKGQGD